jgi:hypothetical protein
MGTCEQLKELPQAHLDRFYGGSMENIYARMGDRLS